MNLKDFLSPQYLFQVNSATVSPQEKLFFFGALVLILLAVVLKIAARLAPNPVDKKVRGKFYSLFLTIGIFELLWYGCRDQNVRFFGTPFVAWLVVLIGVVWFVAIIIGMVKTYRAEKGTWDKEQAKLKYLPK